jgi:hypothetical protein
MQRYMLADCLPAAVSSGIVRTAFVRSSQGNARRVLYLHLVDPYLRSLQSHMYVTGRPRLIWLLPCDLQDLLCFIDLLIIREDIANIKFLGLTDDRLCGPVVRAPGYRSRGSDSIPGTIRFSAKLLIWNGVHSKYN